MTVKHYSMNRQQMVLTVAITLTLLFVHALHAQTYTVLHSFTGGIDGATPYGGLAWDGRGNFYGTAAVGGYTGTTCYGLFGQSVNGCGTVYRLHQSGSNWTFSTLYEFRGGTVDGNFPAASVTIAPDGSLYGTTFDGDYNGSGSCTWPGLHPIPIGCGIVFNLRPPATACTTALCSWTETISWAFPGPDPDGGAGPGLGPLVFDRTGNLYGTTFSSASSDGDIFQLVPSGGSWTIGKVYWVVSRLGQTHDPLLPLNAVTLDAAGNVYTTTQMGPADAPNCGYHYLNGCGTVLQLTPTSSGWTENTIYTFTDGEDGKFPIAGLVADQAGNLYGVSSTDGPNRGGTVFELSPSGGGWTYHTIYALPNGNSSESLCFIAVGTTGCSGPWGTLLMDAAGNLYGASYGNGRYNSGNVFKLTHSNGSWSYTDLYDFTGGNDGANPAGPLILDGNGNLYGTAVRGGSSNCFLGCGVVFEITP